MTFATSIPHNPKGGEFELLCPQCKGIGVVADTGIVCLTCKMIYVEFVAQVTLPLKHKIPTTAK